MKTGGKRRAWFAAGIVLAAAVLGTGGFFVSHLADTVRVDDPGAFLAYVQEQRFRLWEQDKTAMSYPAGSPEREKVPLEVLAQDRLDAYYAALISVDGPESTELWLFQEDPVLRGRYRWIGNRKMRIGLEYFGQPDELTGATVLAVAGYNPLGVIHAYRLWTGEHNDIQDTAAAGYQVKLYLTPQVLESSTMHFYGESGEELTEGDIRQALLLEQNEQYEQEMEIPYVNE